MSDKQVYVFNWRITDGVTKVTADSPEQARELFEAMSVRDYAEDGKLEVDDPVQEVRDDE